MSQGHNYQYVDNEDRRDLLKALGIVGTVAVGGATLEEVQSAASMEATDDLAPIGQQIKSDLAGSIDSSLIASQQSSLAGATQGLANVEQRGFPTDGPREEFMGVAEAGRPIYDHLKDMGFFESTTEHLPEFERGFLEQSVGAFVSSERLAQPLETLDFGGTTGVDVLAEVVGNAERLSTHHWVATDQIPREQIEIGEHIPPMTMGAAGGALLWLEDLDHHLWQKRVMLTDEILADAVWHGQSMAAGFYLMSEAAKVIGAEAGELNDAELGALLSTGFAVQAIAQGLLPEDVYWITEEQRGPRRTDVELVTE